MVTIAAAFAMTGCYAAGARPGQLRQGTEGQSLAPDPAPVTVVSDVAPAAPEPPVVDTPPVEPSEPPPPQPVYAFNDPLPGPSLPADAPAIQFANLSPGQCRQRLRALADSVRRVGDSRGVATEVRLAGSLHGVRFITPGKRSKYGVLDCRLALALDAFAELLAAHDIVEMRIDNFHRPRAHLPGSRKPSQHSYGLAADITQFALSDGTRIVVERDWQTPIGEAACGPDARLAEPTREAVALHDVVCAAMRQGMFNHVLSPSYDRAHRDHLHLDIKRGDRRRMLH